MSGINSTVINSTLNPNNKTLISSVNTKSSSSTSVTTDVDIFPVNSSIDAKNYVYDGQTILMINSTLNQNSNIVKAQYFDPVSGTPGRYGPSLGFGEWNFDLVPTNYLNGMMSSSSLLSENTSIYNNLQSFTYSNNFDPNSTISSTGQYEIDIVNGGVLTPTSTSSSSSTAGTSYETAFFSLTSQPYITYQGEYKFPSGLAQTEPNYNNVNPGYSGNNSDNFIFTSNYYTQQKNEIIIVQLVFTVSNTNSLNILGTTANNLPNVSVIVYNKVISQDNLASVATNNNSKTKVYTAGPIPLQYQQSGTTFNAATGSYSINNNVPIIIADGYQKLYATLPVVYVPPTNDSGSYYGQYLNNGLNADSSPGYYISNSIPTIPTTGNKLNVTEVSGSPQVLYGHFCIGLAYSNDFSTYNPGASILSEVLIKNIWRSPISIYNSYNAFSVNDMATKLVVVLFGKTLNGGTFLVTNTGTPLSLINNYAVTSLRNFMSIMNAVITKFDGTASLVDYFINTNFIQSRLLNYQTLTLQPLLDGGIVNPPTVATCPNMYYLFLNSTNSANMSVDPTGQAVFGQQISQSYFGLNKSTLCSTGVANYFNSSLTMLATSSGALVPTTSYLFANSLYIGLNNINNQNFYMLLILPEALFNGIAASTTGNVLSVYSTQNSLFFLQATNNNLSQFSPTAYRISSTGTTTVNKVSTTVSPSYNINKIVLSASNVLLF